MTSVKKLRLFGQKKGQNGSFFEVPNGKHFKYEVDEHIFQVSETLKKFDILKFVSVPPLPLQALSRLNNSNLGAKMNSCQYQVQKDQTSSWY